MQRSWAGGWLLQKDFFIQYVLNCCLVIKTWGSSWCVFWLSLASPRSWEPVILLIPLGCALQGIRLQWVLMDAMLGSSVTLAQLVLSVCHYVRECSWMSIFDICFVCLGKRIRFSLTIQIHFG